jgi:hypothetical protein
VAVTIQVTSIPFEADRVGLEEAAQVRRHETVAEIV